MEKDLYKILEVPETATTEEIKKSYRRLSLKYHPDKNPNTVEKFQEINEAYETLGDERKRQQYDFGNKSLGLGGVGGFPMENIFDHLFGLGGLGGHGGQGGQGGFTRGFQGLGPGFENIRIFHNGIPVNLHMEKPTPIIQTITIEMETVLTGGNFPVEIERWYIENGLKIFEKETIYVDIPKGADDNEILILRERGNISKEKISGDIKLFIKINNNTSFKRNGLDLIFHKKISLKDSLCGFSFDLKYINGKKYTINNNAGNIIPPHFNKTINNLGLERDGYRGNLIIQFMVEFPETLTTEQMDKLREIL
jgi:DnaJ-class molecular chaperone